MVVDNEMRLTERSNYSVAKIGVVPSVVSCLLARTPRLYPFAVYEEVLTIRSSLNVDCNIRGVLRASLGVRISTSTFLEGLASLRCSCLQVILAVRHTVCDLELMLAALPYTVSSPICSSVDQCR